MAWYTYGTVPVYDPISDTVLENRLGGKLVTVKDGPAVPIRDLNQTPITEIVSNGHGMSSPFMAENLLTGLVQFGELVVTVWANEVAVLALEAQNALAIANTANTTANAASTTAQAAQDAVDDLIADGGIGPGTGLSVPFDVTLAGFNDEYGRILIDDDDTDTSVWPDRFAVTFNPNVGNTVRTFVLNEYGEPRLIPAKSTTTPLRVFVGEDPVRYTERHQDVAVIEVATDRSDRLPKFRVFGDGDVEIYKDLSVAGNVVVSGTLTGANLRPVRLYPTGSEPSLTGVTGPELWVEYTP